uniref:Uncharacterized protein n=1 Tax=Coniophora olivacea TaxID=85977 RepID=A0A896YSR3_9AGAM
MLLNYIFRFFINLLSVISLLLKELFLIIIYLIIKLRFRFIINEVFIYTVEIYSAIFIFFGTVYLLTREYYKNNRIVICFFILNEITVLYLISKVFIFTSRFFRLIFKIKFKDFFHKLIQRRNDYIN